MTTHEENFVIKITTEFRNRAINRRSAVIDYPRLACVLFIFQELEYAIKKSAVFRKICQEICLNYLIDASAYLL